MHILMDMCTILRDNSWDNRSAIEVEGGNTTASKTSNRKPNSSLKPRARIRNQQLEPNSSQRVTLGLTR